MDFKKLNRPLLKPNSNLKHTPRVIYIAPQYLIYASIHKISMSHLLAIGDVSAGDYNIITYATEEEAREEIRKREDKEKKEGKEGELVRILKAFPFKKANMLKNIEGYAVCITTEKDNDLFTILSENDVYLGSNLKIQLTKAMERKEKYRTNLKGEENPIYGMFRPDQVIISALVNVNKKEVLKY